MVLKRTKSGDTVKIRKITQRYLKKIIPHVTRRNSFDKNYLIFNCLHIRVLKKLVALISFKCTLMF